MAQPVGVGVAAISIAVVADRHGIATALWVPTLAAAAAALAVAAVVLDPPRPDRATTPAPSPYRADGYLSRVHGVSVLLVVPQFMVWTFALVWLIDDRGWSPAAAGTLVASAQVAGALGRILAGHLSDRAGGRLVVLRRVAVEAGAFWSGRALGVQNTAQYLTAAVTAPVPGAAVGEWGYATGFALAALFPVVAVSLVPVHAERELS